MIFVPGFLEDDAKLDQDVSIEACKALWQRIVAQLDLLFTWRWQWHHQNPQVVEENIIKDNRRQKLALHFTSLLHAVDILTYDSALIWLLGLLWKLNPCLAPLAVEDSASRTKLSILSPSSENPNCLHLPGSATKLKEVAIEIYHVFDFQMRNIRGHRVSSLFFLMPIGLAWSVLQGDEKWRSSITETLALSRVTKGYQAGQNPIIRGGDGGEEVVERNAFGFGAYAVPRVV
ncbi:uncharacterized protein KY384_006361 [Bacidia gigantensis]|uniref:uncharacterized protein n=1 Tax=Bacidia gigantensis TaxID=2732470 RepID=UPI001D0391EC|nr:uncharacterized protein KY384_006361 [Bacidia gigantensis]KAG8528674.1 hypothetical protein KY384_006361 [Bacidia gigantensis]